MAKRKSKKSDWPIKWVPKPSPGSFMILAMIGFLVTAYLVLPISTDFAVALIVVFAAMFIAAIISTTKAPLMK